jgi:hypothetical protein
MRPVTRSANILAEQLLPKRSDDKTATDAASRVEPSDV